MKAELEPDQKRELQGLLAEFESRFSDIPGLTSLITHDIELTSSQPVRSKAYRVLPRQREILEIEIQKMLALDVIEAREKRIYFAPDPSGSSWQGSATGIRESGIDYRELNLITRDQTYTKPNIEEHNKKVSSALRFHFEFGSPLLESATDEGGHSLRGVYFTHGNVPPKRSGFWAEKRALLFLEPHGQITAGFDDFAVPYLDDVAIFSATWPLKHLCSVLSRLPEGGLTIKPTECQLARVEVTNLGHVIGIGHWRPSEVKVAAIRGSP